MLNRPSSPSTQLTVMNLTATRIKELLDTTEEEIGR